MVRHGTEFLGVRTVARGLSRVDTERQCRSMGPDIIEVDEGTAFAAAALIPFTRPPGLSLGDRVCLATAARDASIAMTGDKAWGSVPDIKVDVVGWKGRLVPG